MIKNQTSVKVKFKKKLFIMLCFRTSMLDLSPSGRLNSKHLKNNDGYKVPKNMKSFYGPNKLWYDGR